MQNYHIMKLSLEINSCLWKGGGAIGPLVPLVPPDLRWGSYRLMIGLKHQCFITRNAHFSVANTCETNARRRYLHRSAYINVCLIFGFEMAKNLNF